jgi:hypothetical protein
MHTTVLPVLRSIIVLHNLVHALLNLRTGKAKAAASDRTPATPNSKLAAAHRVQPTRFYASIISGYRMTDVD